jgi:methylmalonyl-CoA/ethylmalonyl-CoA epimerase
MDLLQVVQHADELDRAAAFYAQLLGDEPAARYDPPGLLFFRLGEVRLLLERGAPSAVLYLAVDDVRARVEELRAQGVTIQAEPHVIFTHDTGTLGRSGTDEWQAFITDSEGNLVGLVSQETPAK